MPLPEARLSDYNSGAGCSSSMKVKPVCVGKSEDHFPRAGWVEAYRAAGPPINDELLLDTLPPNQFDQEDWRW